MVDVSRLLVYKFPLSFDTLIETPHTAANFIIIWITMHRYCPQLCRVIQFATQLIFQTISAYGSSRKGHASLRSTDDVMLICLVARWCIQIVTKGVWCLFSFAGLETLHVECEGWKEEEVETMNLHDEAVYGWWSVYCGMITVELELGEYGRRRNRRMDDYRYVWISFWSAVRFWYFVIRNQSQVCDHEIANMRLNKPLILSPMREIANKIWGYDLKAVQD